MSRVINTDSTGKKRNQNMRTGAELLRRLPSAQVVRVEEAGHSVQGDTPLELATILEDFVFGAAGR